MILDKPKILNLFAWGRKKAIRSGMEASIKTATRTALQRPALNELTYSIYKEASVVAGKILRLPLMKSVVQSVSKGGAINRISAFTTLRHVMAQMIRLNVFVVSIVFVITSIPAVKQYRKNLISKKRFVWSLSKNLLFLLIGVVGSLLGVSYFMQYSFPYGELIGGTVGCFLLTSIMSLVFHYIENAIICSMNKTTKK